MKTALSVLVRAPRPIGLVGGQSVGGFSLRTSFLVSCECRKLIGPFSEAVGVRVQDFEEDVLQLRHRYHQGNAGGDYGKLKTPKSIRNLPLPTWLANRVRALADGTGYCFRSIAKSGTPINRKNALRRYLHPACAELGFRVGGWHDFRHTLTTWALKKYPTKVVSGLLGHSSTKTTLDVYGHVSQEDYAEPLAEMAGKLLHDVAQNGGNQIGA